MNVIVTGGSGFIGSHVVDKLVEAGHNVKVLDLIPPHRKDVELLKASITDIESLKKAMKDIDYVYHLAAVSNVNNAFKNPVLTVELNCLGTANILESARVNNVKKVILASTEWVYSGAKESAVNELTPFHVSGAGHIYTSSKIADELFLHDYQKLYGLPFTILRYGIPYGPGAREETVIPIFVKKALNKEPIQIYGDGLQYRNFLYIEDLAEGNVLALKKEADNNIYNLTGDKRVSIKEIAETIKRFISETKIEYLPARAGDYYGKEVSNEKAKKELGWAPKTEFKDGVKKYIDWILKAESQHI